MKNPKSTLSLMLAYAASMGLSHAALIIGGIDPDHPDGPPTGPAGGLTWDLDSPIWWDGENYVTWKNDGNEDAIFMHDGERNNVNVGEGHFKANSISRMATEGAELNQALKLIGAGQDEHGNNKTSLTVNSFISGGFEGSPKVFEVQNLDLHGEFVVTNTNRFIAMTGAKIYATMTFDDTCQEFRLVGGDISNATIRMNGHNFDLRSSSALDTLTGNGTFTTTGNQTLTIANLTIGANSDGTGGLSSWTHSGDGTLNVNFGGGTVAMTVELNSSLSDTFHINGTLTLGGNLVINTLGTGNFVAGDSYTLFTAGNIVGEFDSITLPELDEGLEWVWENTGNSWTITVTDKIPEPAAIMLLGLGGLATILRRRRC